MARTSLSCLLLSLPLVFSAGVRPMFVVGGSMEPALRPGQLVLLHRGYYRTHRLERDDVVVFRWKGHVYVKRVYALAGEPVKLVDQDGYYTILDESQASKLVRLVRHSHLIRMRTVVVPSGHFFSLGDNRTASIDSRDLGPIPASAILGRVQSLWGSRLPYRPFWPEMACR